MWRRKRGNDHAYVANTLDHLATVLGEQRKHAEAERCMRECLDIRRRVVGDRHSSTVNSRDRLIEVLRKQGRGEEAEKLGREWPAVAPGPPATRPRSD